MYIYIFSCWYISKRPFFLLDVLSDPNLYTPISIYPVGIILLVADGLISHPTLALYPIWQAWIDLDKASLTQGMPHEIQLRAFLMHMCSVQWTWARDWGMRPMSKYHPRQYPYRMLPMMESAVNEWEGGKSSSQASMRLKGLALRSLVDVFLRFSFSNKNNLL